MKNKITNLFRLFVLLGILSLACGVTIDMGGPSPASAPVQPTQPPPPTPIPPTPIPPTPIPPTPIPPTPESPPTMAPPTVPASTATLGPPMFTAEQDSFCRRGPGQIYDVRTSINLGDTVNIFGKSSPAWGDWWYVEVLGLKCWVWSSLGKTSGDLSGVQIVQAPPTPTVANVKLTINNKFVVAICHVYLFDVNNPGLGWSADILAPNIMNPGQSVTWTGLTPGTYNIAVSNCAGSSLDTKSNIQFTGNTIVTFQ